ncbi:hypothetical protein B0J18DRAFT_420362 [Chaetomium sp. MPI-SDFR-AT-0129]|nr:hypothetical protein B0J18DRAFT_420362 [Chaetomium sp. MPI-SDFR-AT-0129]
MSCFFFLSSLVFVPGDNLVFEFFTEETTMFGRSHPVPQLRGLVMVISGGLWMCVRSRRRYQGLGKQRHRDEFE